MGAQESRAGVRGSGGGSTVLSQGAQPSAACMWMGTREVEFLQSGGGKPFRKERVWGRIEERKSKGK